MNTLTHEHWLVAPEWARGEKSKRETERRQHFQPWPWTTGLPWYLSCLRCHMKQASWEKGAFLLTNRKTELQNWALQIYIGYLPSPKGRVRFFPFPFYFSSKHLNDILTTNLSTRKQSNKTKQNQKSPNTLMRFDHFL